MRANDMSYVRARGGQMFLLAGHFLFQIYFASRKIFFGLVFL